MFDLLSQRAVCSRRAELCLLKVHQVTLAHSAEYFFVQQGGVEHYVLSVHIEIRGCLFVHVCQCIYVFVCLFMSLSLLVCMSASVCNKTVTVYSLGFTLP